MSSAPLSHADVHIGSLPAELCGDAAKAWVEHCVGLVERGELQALSAAVAYEGKVVAAVACGQAKGEGGRFAAKTSTLFCGFSTCKVVVAAALWKLVAEQALSWEDPVANWVPGFSDKRVQLRHLLTHQAGFPAARFDPRLWSDKQERERIFSTFVPEWEPGSRFEYHPAATMWLAAAVIEALSGKDFRDYLREDLLLPLGVSELFFGKIPTGLPIAEIEFMGEPPSQDDPALKAIRLPKGLANKPTVLLSYNRPDIRDVGIPGGGAVFNASSLALFFQALLADLRDAGTGTWSQASLHLALQDHTGEQVDPMVRRKARRGLGVALALDDDKIFRGFCPQNSPQAFGHLGVFGQIGWADPASGLSFVFLTSGLDLHPLRMGMRGIGLSSKACAIRNGS